MRASSNRHKHAGRLLACSPFNSYCASSKLVSLIFARHGVETLVEAPVGISLMEAAVTNGIDGIEGECGGSMACGTCHIHILNSDLALPPMKESERDLLEATCDAVSSLSRLGCQILVTEDFNNARLEVP